MANYKKGKKPVKYATHNLRPQLNHFQSKPVKTKASIEIMPVEKGIIIKQFGRNGKFKRAAFQPVDGELTAVVVTDDAMEVDGVRVSLPSSPKYITRHSFGINPAHFEESIPIEVFSAKRKIPGIPIRKKEVIAVPVNSLKVKGATYHVPGLNRVGQLVQSRDLGVRRIALTFSPSHREYRVIKHALDNLSWGGGQGPVPDFDDGEKAK